MEVLKKKKRYIIITLAVIVGITSIFVVINRHTMIQIVREKYDIMRGGIPVFAYHGFAPREVKDRMFGDNKWIDDIEGFERQMKYLHDNGWTTLTADEFYMWHEGKLEIPEKSCMITFDDGYYEMYYTIYPILKKYDFNAISFIIGAYTPDITIPYNPEVRGQIGWDRINEIESQYPGFCFESHSYDLHGFDKDGNEPWRTATEQMLKQDFNAADVFDFEYMAYPYGGYNDIMLKVIKDSNIRMAFTFKTPGYATRGDAVYEIPRQKITAETTYREFKMILEKTL